MISLVNGVFLCLTFLALGYEIIFLSISFVIIDTCYNTLNSNRWALFSYP